MRPAGLCYADNVGTLIDGKAISKKVRAEVAEAVAAFTAETGHTPGLHVVLVGDDPASAIYVRNKEKAAAKVGIGGDVHRLPATTGQAELMALIRNLNQDDSVDGILVQLPLPDGLDSAAVLAELDPTKDVDGLHVQNVGALWSGDESLVACTPRGCIRLLEESGVTFKGARAVVVGRSALVGKPIAALLLARHCTVTLAHSRTQDLAGVCREADILIAAVGREGLVKADWVKPGAIVIDVGINRGEDGKLHGDVDWSASEVAGAMTPVPGGVGPMTIAMLLDNTLRAARSRLDRRARY